MKFKGAAVASVVSMALTGLATSVALAQELPTGSYELHNVASSELTETSNALAGKRQSTKLYVVQIKGQPGVSFHRELTDSTNTAATTLRNAGNNYSTKSPEMQAYLAKIKQDQEAVASDLGGITLIHNYYHTFNGFAAKLSAEQLASVKANPNVAGVWEDELLQMTTANTPAFLGLTGENGQHSLGVKGDGVIVGIVDSGIWPENPSFADADMPAPPEDWAGECNVGTIGDADAEAPADPNGFTCNNKLIGARYFGSSFSSVYDIQFEFGEFNSPRDASGHGSHTASTAAGNFVESATLQGVDVGSLSGIAPNAHIAAYKVCWNSDYVSSTGAEERGCFGSDSQAAIDAAVADGVDVINYSISGSRTDLTAPQTIAMLRAADAGVFVSVSAGNSGPDAGVVGTPAPWVMSVGASTYDGSRSVVADAFEVSIGDEAADPVGAVPAGFGPSWPVGLGGPIRAVDNVFACDPVGDVFVEGEIALISRGGCSFVDKVANAESAGAAGVVVYNNASGGPIVMGGTGTFSIPAVMIGQDEGAMLANNTIEVAVSVTYNGGVTVYNVEEVGNVMASFSSRGQNDAVEDIIKPDITAPGVNVLAATSSAPLNHSGNNPLMGETYAYLSGTSMSSPHIAGMAALLTQQFPDWSPAMKKSALMTTAYQSVLSHDGTAADPFDFGSGHADVLAARTPGFTYDAGWIEYSAYLCGRGRDSVVLEFAGFTCADFESAGFSLDQSQLNYPSIAIGGLSETEVIVREVTNVTETDLVYDVSIEMPAGISVSLLADNDGDETFEISDTFTVNAASGTALYGLVISKTDDAVLDEWVFGSITFTSGDIVNRSPIAIRPVADPNIAVPERVSLALDSRGNASFTVDMKYNGSVSMASQGLATPFGSSGSVLQDEDQTFEFNEAGLGLHFIEVPEGSSLARFSLFDDLVAEENTDLDLIVYRCIDFSCSAVGDSTTVSSNETVELVNPAPAYGNDGSDFYLVWVHGFSVPTGATDYTLVYWVADGTEVNTRMTTSRRAIDGRSNTVRVIGRSLPYFMYMGTATFFDGEGANQGTTVIEAIPQ